MPTAATDSLRDQVVSALTALADDLDAAPAGRGRPPILSDAHLWGCTLLTVLDDYPTQRGIWGEVTSGERFGPPVEMVGETVRKRLLARQSTPMAGFFTQITALLTQTLAGDATLAPFATEVYALDATTLDKIVRSDPDTGQRSLARRVHTCFDLRRQLFQVIALTPNPAANERPLVPPLVAGLPTSSLLIMDRGYTSFALFDRVVGEGFDLLTRYDKTFTVVHSLTDTQGVRDELGFCGGYRADKRQTLLRRITVPVPGSRPRTCLTSVRDPAVLPPSEAVRLYARRWDVEVDFKTIKRGLGLHLIWSNQWTMIALQIWATLVIFQIASGIRAEIARRAGISLFEVSLQLLVQRLPRIVQGPQGRQDAHRQPGPLRWTHPPGPADPAHRASGPPRRSIPTRSANDPPPALSQHHQTTYDELVGTDGWARAAYSANARVLAHFPVPLVQFPGVRFLGVCIRFSLIEKQEEGEILLGATEQS